MSLKFDEAVTAKVEMRLWFDGVEVPEVVEKLMSNGRFTGFLVEPLAARLCGETFEHLDVKGYDLKSLDPEEKNREVKSFTKYGAKLGPSTFYGAGRKPDPALFESTIAPSKDFIVVDQTRLAQTGEVHLVLKRGTDVAKIGHEVKPKDRAKLFG